MIVPSLLSPAAAGFGMVSGLGFGVDLAGLLGSGGLPISPDGASPGSSKAVPKGKAGQAPRVQSTIGLDRSTSMPLPMEAWESQTDEALLKAHLDGRDGAFRALLEDICRLRPHSCPSQVRGTAG